MRKSMKWILIILILFYSFISNAQQNTSISATEALNKVQKFYEKVRDFQSDFNQTYKNKLLGNKNSKGKLYLLRPGKMRWEYFSPSKKLIVSDGRTIWIYEPGANQVFKRPIKSSQLPTAITFLTGQGNLANEFKSRVLPNNNLNKVGKIVLELTPLKTSPHYVRIVFVVNPQKSWEVEKTIIVDHQGNTNTFSFSNAIINKGVKATLFNFKMPDGVELIEE